MIKNTKKEVAGAALPFDECDVKIEMRYIKLIE